MDYSGHPVLVLEVGTYARCTAHGAYNSDFLGVVVRFENGQEATLRLSARLNITYRDDRKAK